VLLGIFGGIYLLKFLYLFLFTGRIHLQRVPEEGDSCPLSLLLTFRNEAENLRKNVPPLLLLPPSDVEIVAVDDFSQDASLSVLGKLKHENRALKISSLNQETRHSEKMARNIALKAAGHPWVMVLPPAGTGIDSRWLRQITSRLNDGKEVVVGYSTIKPEKGFYNLLYRCEAFFQQMKSYGFILNGLPFLFFEENVAFRKEKYFEVKGFQQKISEPYAHLELLINLFIRKATTRIVFSGEAVLREDVHAQRQLFTELLKKEVRIRKHLSFFKRLVLSIDRMVTLLFIPSAVLVFLFIPALWPVYAVLLSVFVLAFSLIIKISLNRLNEPKIFLPSLLVALVMPYYKWIFQGGFSYFSRKQRWWNKR